VSLRAALVVVLPELRLEEVRARFDAKAVAAGIPLHVTLLFPFGRDEEGLDEVFARWSPLRFSLTRVETFPEALRLVRALGFTGTDSKLFEYLDKRNGIPGGRYEDAEVVHDGHLITSRKPEDLQQFSAAIVDHLEGADSDLRETDRDAQDTAQP